MDPERKQARLVTSGWIARGAILSDGRRQIVGLSLPGDVIVASGSADADLQVWVLTEIVSVDATAFWTALSQPGVQASPERGLAALPDCRAAAHGASGRPARPA